MKTKIHIYVASVLVIMLCGAALMGVLWLPGLFAYLAEFLPDNMMILLHILCGVIALVLFGILVSAFVFPKAIVHDTIFTSKTAKQVKWISAALFFDCILLCGASVWLIVAGEKLLMPALLFVSLIGVMVSLAIYILSDYIARAAILKEEADATL